jgi:hypothetical protein
MMFAIASSSSPANLVSTEVDMVVIDFLFTRVARGMISLQINQLLLAWLLIQDEACEECLRNDW